MKKRFISLVLALAFVLSLAPAMAQEEGAVQVLCTNGEVTVGRRRESSAGAYRLVYSTDGVTWQEAETPEGYEPSDFGNISSGRFYVECGVGSLSSGDGIRWQETENLYIYDPAWSVAISRYYFILRKTGMGTYDYDVFLSNKYSEDIGVYLPDMGRAIRERRILPGFIQAWKGPEDTVILAVYDREQGEGNMVSMNYPASSLDWCMENLSERLYEEWDAVALTLARGEAGDTLLVSTDGKSWDENVRTWVGQWSVVQNVPWGKRIRLLPYNGKTFLVLDQEAWRLYASETGLAWREVEALRPKQERTEHGKLEYAISWTGRDYIACYKAWEDCPDGVWDQGNTRVYLLDGNFQLTACYDFGRQVERVGWYQGKYYALVSNEDGAEGSVLYRSADGEGWEELGREYMDIQDILQVHAGPKSAQNIVGGADWGMRKSHLELVAEVKLERWQFFLTNEGEVYLMWDDASGWVHLPHIGQAARNNYVDPAFLSATYNGDGTVKVEVTDRWSPEMKASISYPTDSLDWVKENLGEAWERNRVAEKEGAGDVAMVTIPTAEEWIVHVFGEEIDCSEKVFSYTALVRRGEDTGGRFAWYDEVPWSSAVYLLPFSGKDFMAIDPEARRFYLSADGVTWRQAAGDWIAGIGAPTWGSNCYTFLWTGEYYLVSCAQSYSSRNGGGRNQEHDRKIYLLDEELNLLYTAEPGKVEDGNYYSWESLLGFWDGVYYACIGIPIKTADDPFMAIFRSVDGKSWEQTDIPRGGMDSYLVRLE